MARGTETVLVAIDTMRRKGHRLYLASERTHCEIAREIEIDEAEKKTVDCNSLQNDGRDRRNFVYLGNDVVPGSANVLRKNISSLENDLFFLGNDLFLENDVFLEGEDGNPANGLCLANDACLENDYVPVSGICYDAELAKRIVRCCIPRKHAHWIVWMNFDDIG